MNEEDSEYFDDCKVCQLQKLVDKIGEKAVVAKLDSIYKNKPENLKESKNHS